ncbi:MAG: hypothetical protein GY757_53215 [bacterium]|nr:hypothetical protein [bacterium]
MKKTIIFTICICLLSSITLVAFEKGTKTLGGSLGYSSQKYHSDSDSYHSLAIVPEGGYFVTGKLCLNIGVGLNTRWSKASDAMPSYSLKIGGRYFVNNFYGGLSFIYSTHKSNYYAGEENNYEVEEYWEKSKSLELRLGHLSPITKNIYLDLGVFYKAGLGDNTNTSEYLSSVKNDQTTLGTTAGVAVFFK